MEGKDFSTVTPEIRNLAAKCRENKINVSLYDKYEVKRGLRDINGKGVLTGLTEISEVKASEVDEQGVSHPCEGKLYYRGYDVEDIIRGFTTDKRFGFEEVTYLLIFGHMPNEEELNEFNAILGKYRCIPPNFVRDIIMKNPAYKHSHIGGSLIIHEPDPNMSTAENILHLLRDDGKFTPLEAEILDIALVLHAEHGGGNNSTFTTRVVTSSGTDTYSAMVSALASLKGPKHGGANLKVVEMFKDIKEHVKNWDDEDELTEYLDAILHKQAFDKTGLVYGMGHAVYSLSDPRARVFKGFVEELSVAKNRDKEFKLMSDVERIAAQLIAKERKIYKGVSANVDFYSGFVYSMLGLPHELYTPLFAIARISGWSAHRIEELVNCNKIIRPAYKNICEHNQYISLKDR